MRGGRGLFGLLWGPGQPAVLVVVLVMLGGVVYFEAPGLLTWIFPPPDLSFEPAQWAPVPERGSSYAPSLRQRMLEDLLASEQLANRSTVEVEALLGKPQWRSTTSDGAEWIYLLGDGVVGPDLLQIQLNSAGYVEELRRVTD